MKKLTAAFRPAQAAAVRAEAEEAAEGEDERRGYAFWMHKKETRLIKSIGSSPAQTFTRFRRRGFWKKYSAAEKL